jgi:hypothetical protein
MRAQLAVRRFIMELLLVPLVGMVLLVVAQLIDGEVESYPRPDALAFASFPNREICSGAGSRPESLQNYEQAA